MWGADLRRAGRYGGRGGLVDFDEALRIDLHDIAAQLRAQERPHDGHQRTIGEFARIQELNDVVVGTGDIDAGAVAVRTIEELEAGAVRVGAIQADLAAVGRLPT